MTSFDDYEGTHEPYNRMMLGAPRSLAEQEEFIMTKEKNRREKEKNNFLLDLRKQFSGRLKEIDLDLMSVFDLSSGNPSGA